jgi:hypothetical protein
VNNANYVELYPTTLVFSLYWKDNLKYLTPESKTINIKLVTVTAFMTVVLANTTLISYTQQALAAKPFFPKNPIGLTCSLIYDEIQALRNKSNRQGGQLSADDQEALDGAVDTYNQTCRPWYGGNPQTDGTTDMGSGSVLNPNLSPDQSNKNQPQSNPGSLYI